MSTCKDCKHSLAHTGNMQCRRFPPSQGNYFPLVDPTTWCGEFAAKETPKAKEKPLSSVKRSPMFPLSNTATTKDDA